MGYRMIIADDERMIIQLIRQLGRWEELGIEIIDECYDGEAALASILANKPDFVLSDIQMPVYDGIELIEKVREHDSEVLFILLSGYRYFEYARSAIQLNVVDYLLKPVDERQLNEILEKVCQRVDQMRRQASDSEKLKDYQSADELSRQTGFWEILTGRKRSYDKSLLQRDVIRERFGIDFVRECFQVICVDTNLTGILGAEDSLFGEKIADYIRSTFETLADVVWRADVIGHILILNYEETRRNDIYNAVQALFYSIRDLSEVYGEFRLNIGCSSVQTGTEELAKAVWEAMEAEWGHLVFFGNKVLRYEQVCALPSFEPQDVIAPQELKKIGECVKYLQSGELGEIFSAISRRAVSCNNSSTGDMIRVCGRLMQEILAAIPAERQEMEERHYYMAYQNARNFQEIFKNIYAILVKYIQDSQEQLNEKRGRPVEDALQFMRKNYGTGISLEDAAADAGVSASYLSRIFKEKTGTGFNEYLMQLRIEESEKLLADSKLSIKEIAARVGYADEKYYSKLFKKSTGIRPSDYRRLYG